MAKSGTSQVVLVRSGRTEWDDADRLQGQTELPVSPAGLEEVASSLDAFLDSVGDGFRVSGVFSGPDEGGRQTASLVGRRLDARTKSAPGLRAMDLGLWEGLLRSELLDRYPKAYKNWRDDPASVNVPDGETLADLERRLLPALARIADRATSRPAAIVLRPLPLALLVARLTGRPTSEVWAVLDETPRIQLFTLERARTRALLDSLKASA